jgi:hypothetical protein
MTTITEPPRSPARYVLLSGSGRSGSNNLLDILDTHPDTLCRSEPAGVPGTVMSRLPKGGFRPGDEPQPFPPDFLALWRATVAEAGRRNAKLDHFLGDHKRYFRHPWLARLFQPLFGSGTARRWMARVAPVYGEPEWPIPALYVSPARLAQALPVFKIGCAAGWIGRVIEHEPGLRVVHNIRDPRGYVQSWFNRYVVRRRGGDSALVYARTLRTLGPMLAHYGVAWPHGETVSEVALVEAELWRWRYLNEAMLDHAHRPGQSMTVFYDEVMRDRLAVAERIMAFCGLAVDEATRARIGAQQRRLFTEPHATSVDPAILDAALSRVLGGSRMEALLAGRAPATSPAA